MTSEVGLVLAGGGARGAYEVGALSELLPRLKPDERPTVIVGTSVGAINAAYVAATADRPPGEALEEGCEIWRDMRWESALSPLLSMAQVRLALRSAADALGIPGAHGWSMLNPAPLRATLDARIPFERIHANVESKHIRAAAVVGTRASTSLSVVFCDTNAGQPQADDRRGITYVRTSALSAEHVIASAAIPGAFPAVEIHDPPSARGWYYDGGTRLNTPIRPALDLGAGRMIITALHSPRLGSTLGDGERPQVLDGVAQLLQGVLVDPLINDVHTLATINRQIAEGGQSGDASLKPIPYILIAPEQPNEIGDVATRCYQRLHGRRKLFRRRGSVARLGRLLDIGDSPWRGELLSYFFFDPEFANELIELGRRDARRWLSVAHDDGVWQLGPAV